MATAEILLQGPRSSPSEVYGRWGGETIGCLLCISSLCLRESSPVQGVRGTRSFLENKNLYLIVGCYSNAHHTAWGSTNCNGRGDALIDFLNSSNLEIVRIWKFLTRQ